MASLGDIHNTPFYDTAYQHAHGYNERNMSAKAAHWEREYQHHAPSAARIRQRFIVKPGRDEVGRTLGRDAQVQEVIQARTALLGASYDTSTRNSLRVTQRHGESQRLGENVWPIPSRAQSAYGASARAGAFDPIATDAAAAHEAWSLSTIPADRTSSLRMGGSAGSLRHPSTRVNSTASQPWNSRQGSWETEYSSGFSQVKSLSGCVTARPDFLSRSLNAFHDPINHPTDTHVHKVPRPLSPTQPLLERQTNERISQPSLVSMQRPVHRKIYPDLEENCVSQRPEPYSFDMRVHIDRMRPTPLFKDRIATGERVSAIRTERPTTLQQYAAEATRYQTRNQFNSTYPATTR